MIIVKRDPVTIGVVLSAIVLMLGYMLGWSVEFSGSVVAVITVGVGVVQALNVFGTDAFVALAINFVAAILTAYTAWSGIPVSDSLKVLIMGLITAVLGMVTRNGVTNKTAPNGTQRDALVTA